MKRFEGTDPVTHAMNQVLTRMNGCAEEECSACDRNFQAITELVREVHKRTSRCLACKAGEIFMNVDPPFEGYTNDQTSKVNWPEHNAKGQHHILWNGDSNETVLCGSERCNELTKYNHPKE